MDKVYDVAIIGGGINGCGCAADAAQRGLSVVLCEKDDIASKTSSSSTKLIHGGLRYLEQYNFGMVKKALDERQTLLNLAPYLVKPLPMVLPHKKNMRPIWMLRMGLFIYDHLSRKNTLPKTRFIRRATDNHYFMPLAGELDKGFLFHDCTTDDSRLTIINALQAKNHGATILTRTNVINAETKNKLWLLTVNNENGESYQIRAKSIINAAGPWVEPMNNILSIHHKHQIAAIKGSHIIVHKLYEGDHAYLLQHSDDRVVFVIPYHGHTMVGTTDIHFNGSLDEVSIDSNEINYLLNLVNQYFSQKINERDILHTWSGLRPLLASTDKEPNQLSRDYVYEYTNNPAPAITIYSGKITTYRQLAAKAVTSLRAIFPELPGSKTANSPLPGTDIDHQSFIDYQQTAKTKYQWLDSNTLTRYLNTYGTYTDYILDDKSSLSDLGIKFAETVYQAEIDYLMAHEWAHTLEDIIWRRTKLGLSMGEVSQRMLAEYIQRSKSI